MKQALSGLFLVGYFLLTGAAAEAATLYMNPTSADIHPGDTLGIMVRIDPDADECVNVVNGVIEYDPGIQPVDISRGESIFPIWVEEPTIDAANNRITFAGGVPNGYCGRIDGDPRLTNVVMEIILQAPGLRIGFGDLSPTSTLRFAEETSVLLNDGLGTQAPLVTFGTDIFVHKKPGTEVVDDWNRIVAADNQLPEQFSISLNQDDSIFNSKYFIVFNTTDKQTGIDHYEVIEEPIETFDLFTWGAVDAPWRKVKSPYVLSDQTLNSTIRVKAIDKAGNEYIATLVPDSALRGMSSAQAAELGIVVAGGALAGVVLIGAVFIVWRRIRKKRYLVTNENEVSYESEA